MKLVITNNRDDRLREGMKRHYSKPLGFVGRNICYAIFHNELYYGHIIGGSATKFLPGRENFFPMDVELCNIVNNIYYHIEPITKYPLRNFCSKILETWRESIKIDWPCKYGDRVEGFESLIEPPRSGECYRRDGWYYAGVTKGYTCKRTAGKGTDSWSGKRVWKTEEWELKPKRVFLRDS